MKKVTVPYGDVNGQNTVLPRLMENGWNGKHMRNKSEHFYFDTDNRCLIESEKHRKGKGNK